MSTPNHTHAIRLTLQAEGLAIGALCILMYAQLAGGWMMFALLILAPDVVMLGYLAGTRIGALCYNIGHSYVGPALLGGAAWMIDAPTALLLALIWGAHIGLDRGIGYGLKYATHFKDTHLNRV